VRKRTQWAKPVPWPHTAIDAWPLVIPVMALLMPDWLRFNRYQFKLDKK
jgi:hypothetical protein